MSRLRSRGRRREAPTPCTICWIFQVSFIILLLKADLKSTKKMVKIGGGQLFYVTKRAMVKKDYKELDETIKAKIQPYLYNEGKGAMVPIAQLACLRNRDRPKSKQVLHMVLFEPPIPRCTSSSCLFSSLTSKPSVMTLSTLCLRAVISWPNSQRD